MVIFYDINNPTEVHHTENYVMYPELPVADTLEEKKAILQSQGLDFVSIPYELGEKIFGFTLCFDINNNFTGLQPK